MHTAFATSPTVVVEVGVHNSSRARSSRTPRTKSCGVNPAFSHNRWMARVVIPARRARSASDSPLKACLASHDSTERALAIDHHAHRRRRLKLPHPSGSVKQRSLSRRTKHAVVGFEFDIPKQGNNHPRLTRGLKRNNPHPSRAAHIRHSNVAKNRAVHNQRVVVGPQHLARVRGPEPGSHLPGVGELFGRQHWEIGE